MACGGTQQAGTGADASKAKQPVTLRVNHRTEKYIAEARPEVERVILFGSLARGDAVPGSDADLLVVLSSAERPFLSRMPDYGLIHCAISVDVFPYTEDELAQKLAASPRWAAAIRDGITLFERTPQPHPATQAEGRSSAL